MLKHLRNYFITGIIILLPLGVTVMVVQFLLKNIGANTSKFFFWFLDANTRNQAWLTPLLDFAAIIIVVILITFLGIISKYFLGRFLVNVTESIVEKVPFVNTVYRTAKQIVDTFSKEHRAVFQKSVLIEYPRPGVFALGFITSRAKGEVQDKTQAEVINVFVPTTPNPTSGFLLMLPKDQVIELDMSIGDCMKVIISGGAVVPPLKNQQLPSTEKDLPKSQKD